MSNPSTKMQAKRLQDALGQVVRLRDELHKMSCAFDSKSEQLTEANDEFTKLNDRFKEFEGIVYNMTATLDEHPQKSVDDDDLYDGPCLCAECRSYGL